MPQVCRGRPSGWRAAPALGTDQWPCSLLPCGLHIPLQGHTLDSAYLGLALDTASLQCQNEHPPRCASLVLVTYLAPLFAARDCHATPHLIPCRAEDDLQQAIPRGKSFMEDRSSRMCAVVATHDGHVWVGYKKGKIECYTASGLRVWAKVRWPACLCLCLCLCCLLGSEACPALWFAWLSMAQYGMTRGLLCCAAGDCKHPGDHLLRGPADVARLLQRHAQHPGFE